ncbi:hypothetical protein I5677_07035 [Mobilitalea sibirica]|uniref:Peptidase M50 domain-containing protein n=2 Tax=Mobilitalea sibirica TaxID=1462919 RepID=A0A8J7HDD5_9FIRM|nr:hypothetical protein [Mobilitalea sibirica]
MASVQLVIHEVGHCIFGLLTGFQFIFIRIGSITLIKREGKIIIKRHSLPGSAGQCLMRPAGASFPVLQEASDCLDGFININYRYGFYMMGGIILNIIMSAMMLILAFSSFDISISIRFSLLLGTFYGLGYALINGIPNTKGKINNDATNFFYLRKDPLAKICGFIQMSILPYMITGYTYKNFPNDMMKVPKGADLSNAIIGWHKLNECYYLMDLRQWENAEDCLKEFDPYLDRLSRMLKETVLLETLFINIKIGKRSSVIEDLYHILKPVLSNKKADFHITRVRMAYELYKDKSDINIEKVRFELDRITQNYSNIGEADFCYRLIKDIIIPG